MSAEIVGITCTPDSHVICIAFGCFFSASRNICAASILGRPFPRHTLVNTCIDGLNPVRVVEAEKWKLGLLNRHVDTCGINMILQVGADTRTYNPLTIPMVSILIVISLAIFFLDRLRKSAANEGAHLPP